MLSVWIFTAPTSTSQWWDVSGSLVGVSVSTHERGYLECILSLNVDGQLAKSILAAGGTPWVEVSDNGAPVWSGRIERTGRVDGVVTLFARGAYSALTDRTHTAIYAMSDAGKFKPVETALNAPFNPSWWDLRKENAGIRITPRRGETHGGSTNIGGMYWVCPFSAYQQITNLSFSYSFIAPAGWYFRVFTYTYNAGASMTYVGNPYSLNGNGAVQSGSQSISFSAVDVVVFAIVNTNGAAALAVDTGTYYVDVTDVSVMGGGSSIATPIVVAGAIGQVSAQNPGQISSSMVLVTASETVTDAVYQYADVQDILAECAALGDGSNGPVEYGVWDDRTVFFNAAGTNARTWYTDESGFEIERGFEDVWNSIRSMYTDSFGNIVGSAVAEDSLSLAHWGIYRARRFDSGASRLNAANDHASTTIQRTAAIVPSARGALRSVFDVNGISFPLSSVRAGDILAIRSLEYGDSVDTINRFVISRTRYAAVVGSESLTIELQSPNASSSAFIAGAANRTTTVARPPIRQ